MSDPIANCTLELACTVGSLENAMEAIEDGADVNFRGGAPLFLAIFNRNREVINYLIDQGADANSFIAKKNLKFVKTREDLIEELIACAPHNPRDVKIDEIKEIDCAIREGGVEYLLAEINWDNATRFRDSLNAIGAGSTHRCIAEFLQWARSERSEAESDVENFISCNTDAVTEYRERYLATGEDLVGLASNFLDEASDSN